MRYGPEAFPLSSCWRGGGEHATYAEWASQTANQFCDAFRARRPIENAIAAIATSRHQIAAEMNTDRGERFGTPRVRMSLTHILPTQRKLHQRAVRKLQETVNEPLRFEHDGLPSRVLRKMRPTHCDLLSGERLEATRVNQYLEAVTIYEKHYQPGTIVLEHSVPKASERLQEDVISRIERLREDCRSTEEPIAPIAEIVFGFYHAMFYARGSSSIGRSMFAGLITAVTGRRLRQSPAELDVFVMTCVDRIEFVEDFTRYWRDPGTWA